MVQAKPIPGRVLTGGEGNLVPSNMEVEKLKMRQTDQWHPSTVSLTAHDLHKKVALKLLGCSKS